MAVKKVFWSGNTNMKNGCNQQRWGIASVDDDTDPYVLANHICDKVVKESGADTFCLVAFNEISAGKGEKDD